jgi:hypothetical protein
LHSSFGKKVRVTCNQGTPEDNGKVKKKHKLESQSQDQSFYPQALSKKFHKEKIILNAKEIKKLLRATNQLEHKGDRNREEKKEKEKKVECLMEQKGKKEKKKLNGANHRESSTRRRNAKP